MLRQPIIAVLGHVDHGKTSLLDRIRQTAIAAKEAGGITQAIGTTEIPSDIIKDLCEKLLRKFHIEITIPGLLFIDTPGHEAFTTLRKRGGSIADLAILVIDINEGLMPQTTESLGILKNSKVPFIIAVNKIDRIAGWQSPDDITCFSDNLHNQAEDVMTDFDKKFYKLIEQLYELGFEAERFDRVLDFKTKIAAVPLSAKTGEGVPELLAILSGLAQQFLKNKLITTDQAKGTILETKEVTGLGTTIDTIIYDGVVKKNDYLVIGGRNSTVTKVRALLIPDPLRDIRVEKKFKNIDLCKAATGVRIVAPGLENVIAGSEIRTAKSEEEAKELLSELEKEREVEFMTGEEGLILKADTIGSLEALINVFRKYPIREAKIGPINKEDVFKAEVNQDPLYKIIIGFNVPVTADAEIFARNKGVGFVLSNVIYRLIEDYEKWVEKERKAIEERELEVLTRPGKIKLLPGCVFRASNPAIVGCEVVGGIIKSGYRLMKDNKVIGEIKQLQSEGKNIDEAKIGDKVAISISGPIVGRQIDESDTLYTDIKSDEYKQLIKHAKLLKENEKSTLEEIKEIKKRYEPMWGF